MSTTAQLPTHRLTLRPLTPAIGAQVENVNLSDEHDVELQEQLRAALARHGVLVLRDQHVQPQDYLRFARIFGEPDRHNIYLPTLPDHPLIEVLESNHSINKDARADAWHTDVTWRTDAPAITLLHGQVIPRSGGDTLWASTAGAYERLAPSLQEFLGSLHAIHSFEVSGIREALVGRREGGYGETGTPEKLAQARIKFAPVVHPVVKTHPVTGRKILYVNPSFTSHIRDIPKEQSNLLLNLIYDLFKTPELQLRLNWQPGTVAIWDNRQTVHYGTKDYGEQPRKLHRITLQHDGRF